MKNGNEDKKVEEKKENQNNEENKDKKENKENIDSNIPKQEGKGTEKVNEGKKEEIEYSSINGKSDYLYTEDKIKELMDKKDQTKEIISQLYISLFKKKNENFKENQIKAIIHFHTKKIEFLLDKFKSYPISIITKLANIFSSLLELKEEDYNPKVSEPSNESKILPEPDFNYIITKKMKEIKEAFIKFNLFPSNGRNEAKKGNFFYLTDKELKIIMNYLNQCYFPFIRLFYHTINLHRIELKNINNNKTNMTQISNDDMDAPEKFILEEQVRVKANEESNINQKIDDTMKNKFKFDEKQKYSVHDYSSEIRNLINEKINELKKDVDAKLSENEFEIERNVQNIKEQYFSQNKKK